MAEHAVAPAGQLTGHAPDDEQVADDTAPAQEPNHAAAQPDPPSGEIYETQTPRPRWWSPTRIAVVIGVVCALALASVLGWLVYLDRQFADAAQQQQVFLEVGRQGALNLTTIDWQHAERDVARIMDQSTSPFRDDFAQRSPAFVELIDKSKSTTVGTVTQAGIESSTADSARVLVAVTVKTSNAAAPQQPDRSWRMRITVQKSGDQTKVSDVEFVP
jgi:Mce-associated membrane protein